LPNVELKFKSIDVNFSLKDKIYGTIKNGITSMNIYSDDAELRLDERRLSEKFEISRTPVREALARLEQEGLVQIVPRRGVYIVRKTKAQILEMITVWAALESMASRLVVDNASDKEIASLKKMFTTFEGNQLRAKIDEYSETNIEFHQAIITLSQCALIREMAENLFIHMRSIRARTISEEDRIDRSIIDHMDIIEALEERDADLASKLVLEHSLNLASHIKKYVNYFE
jgi:DNA-binding GntR family transcriptional regulator